MQPLKDQSAFEWISRTRDRGFPNWPGVQVSDLLPQEFEAYARILHHLEASYDEIDSPLEPPEKSLLRIPDCEPLRSFVQSRRRDSPTTRIKWQELATLLDVPFAPEINFSWFRKRMYGWCVSRFLKGSSTWPVGRESQEVCLLLKNLSRDKQCFFRFPDRVSYTAPEKPLLLTGALDDVDAYLKTEHYPYFEYWWPSDHQWCLCYDDDISQTIVAGPRQLISALMASSILECIEVKPTTRVDHLVPIPGMG